MPQILQGNALDVLPTLPENSFDLCYTSPNPVFYKIGENQEVIGAQTNTHDYCNRLVEILDKVKDVLKQNGSLFVNLGDYYDEKTSSLRLTPMLFALMMQKNGWNVSSVLIWHRTEDRRIKRGSEHGFVKDWEYLFHFTILPAPHFYFNPHSNNYWKTSVLIAPVGEGLFNNEFDAGYPEKLIEIAIKTTVPEKNGRVLDVFAGSGTVGTVAKRLNRDFTLIDINPEICNLLRIKFNVDQNIKNVSA